MLEKVGNIELQISKALGVSENSSPVEKLEKNNKKLGKKVKG